MDYRNISFGVTVVALASVITACGNKQATDDQVTRDIQAKLYADAVTKPANINVAVSNGTVTLTGDVPTSDVELEAMKIANGTGGVKSVSDQMKVTSAANTSQPAPGYPPASTANDPAASASTAPRADSSARSDHRDRDRGTETGAERHRSATLPAGTRISVRMTDPVDSSTNSAGQTFRASLDTPITSGDRVLVPAGAPCTVSLVNAAESGRMKGQSALEVRLTSIDYHGRPYRVDSSVYNEVGKARGKQTLERTGIGAAAGAVIGALAGHGKGAAIGAAAGGGAGLGYNLLTHGNRVKIPSEAVLAFRLEAPLTL